MPDVLSIIASLVTIVAQTGVIAEQQNLEQQPPIEVIEIEINSRRDEIIQSAIDRKNRILSQTQL